MSLPIIYGYGKKLKKIGCVGWDQCPHCKEFGTLMLSEHFKNVNVYFIPVIKWNKKNYLVCDKCDAAYELNDEQYIYYLNKSRNLPDKSVDNCIINSISNTFSKLPQYAEKYPDNYIEKIFEKCVKNACVIYDDKDYVIDLTRAFFISNKSN